MTDPGVLQPWRARAGLAVLLLALVAFAVMLAGFGRPASAAVDERYKIADGLAVYLGVLPAQVLRGHPPAHAERSMHGGPPGGRHDYHLVIAVFDAASGARINDANVTATVFGLGYVGSSRRQLEPMSLADTVTYGGFIALPGNDRYTITIEIRRPGQGSPVRVDFVYQHGAR
jgi:hypothetical protein